MTSATAANDTTLDHSGIVYRSPTADTRETGAMDTSGNTQPTMSSAAPPSPADQWTGIANAQQAAAPVAGTTRASSPANQWTGAAISGVGAVGRMGSAINDYAARIPGALAKPISSLVPASSPRPQLDESTQGLISGLREANAGGEGAAMGAAVNAPSPPTVTPGAMIPRMEQRAGKTMDAASSPAPLRGVLGGKEMPAPLTGTGQPTPGPTTEQTNAIARAQLDSMNAAERQQAQGERERGDLANTAAFAGNQAADLAARSKELGANADVNNFYAGQKGHIGAARVGRQQLTEAGNMANSATAAGRTATDIGARAATAGQQDYIAQAAARQKAAQEATQTEGAKQALPAAGEGAKQEQQKTALGQFQLNIQSHVAQLQQAATAPGPEGDQARQALVAWNMAQQGKGGQITPEQALDAYTSILKGAAASYQMGNTNAYQGIPDFQAFHKGLATGQWTPGGMGSGEGVPSKLSDGQYQDGKGNVYTVKGGVRTLTQANTK